MAETFRFAVTDAQGIEAVRRSFGPWREALLARAGIDLEFVAVSHRTMAVQLLTDRQVDLVFAGPAEYVVIRHRTDVVPVVGIRRATYRAMLVVRADGPIRSLADLEGRQIGLGPRGSTSRHLAPLQMLAERGLREGVDFRVQHMKVGLLLEGLRRGDFAAIGINNTDLQGLRARLPDVALRPLASSDELPIDVFAVPSDMPRARVDMLRAAIRAHGDVLAAAIAAGAEMSSYLGMRWELDALDERYFDAIRRMYATIGIPDFLRPDQ